MHNVKGFVALGVCHFLRIVVDLFCVDGVLLVTKAAMLQGSAMEGRCADQCLFGLIHTDASLQLKPLSPCSDKVQNTEGHSTEIDCGTPHIQTKGNNVTLQHPSGLLPAYCIKVALSHRGNNPGYCRVGPRVPKK